MPLTKKQRSMVKWTKQNWGTKSGKKSSETGERYLDEKARDALSSDEYAATSRKKREDTKKGKQHSALVQSCQQALASLSFLSHLTTRRVDQTLRVPRTLHASRVQGMPTRLRSPLARRFLPVQQPRGEQGGGRGCTTRTHDRRSHSEVLIPAEPRPPRTNIPTIGRYHETTRQTASGGHHEY